MNQTVKERLILFIKSLNLSQARFEKQCGLANGYVNNIRKSITVDKLQQIALTFPQLNKGWLLTGEGEMFLEQEKPLHPMVAKAEALMDKLIASLEETIESQKQVIEKQNAEIERLQRALLEKEAK